MGGKLDYPPAVRVHGVTCAEIKDRVPGLTRLSRAQILRDYPNGQPDLACLSPGDTVAVIEVVEYPPHRYEASTVVYPNATKALCRVCGGTHGTVDALILPPGVARNLGSNASDSSRTVP
jgi:hypothetical protein